MRLLLIAATALTLTACATHSGVVDTGGGSYFVSRQAATGMNGMSSLRADALTEAAAVCRPQGKSVEVVSERQTDPPYVLGNYPRIDLTFRCA